MIAISNSELLLAPTNIQNFQKHPSSPCTTGTHFILLYNVFHTLTGAEEVCFCCVTGFVEEVHNRITIPMYK